MSSESEEDRYAEDEAAEVDEPESPPALTQVEDNRNEKDEEKQQHIRGDQDNDDEGDAEMENEVRRPASQKEMNKHPNCANNLARCLRVVQREDFEVTSPVSIVRFPIG